MFPPAEKKFLLVSRITIISLFALILAGGVVRSSGSGMGCPDWPKCFDSYIPPVSESQVPAGYQEKYVAKRVKKNEHFAGIIEKLGYTELAYRIRNDKSILVPEDFNAAKTWTEYINRVIGALTGFFMLGCAFFSWTYLDSKKRIFYLSLLNIFLVIFQAWLGSIVVSTNLLAWVVTVHMLVAFVIIAITIYTYFEAQSLRNTLLSIEKQPFSLKVLAGCALLLTLLQVIAGTELRERIDAVSSAVHHMSRGNWVEMAGSAFNIHRDSAIPVMVFNVMLFVVIRYRFGPGTLQFKYAVYGMVLLLLQVLTGVVLAYLGLPGFAQAIHVLLAVLLFSSQLYLLLLLKNDTNTVQVS